MIASDFLRDAAQLFGDKGAEYGHTYKRFGYVMSVLLPNGVTLNTPEEFNRFCAFLMVVHKLCRYGNQFSNGGHMDSSQDMTVYASILSEMTEKRK